MSTPFPGSGLYDVETLIFHRAADGRATEVEAASVVFRRCAVDGDPGTIFQITPARAAEEVRRATAGMSPHVEPAKPRRADLIDLTAVVPGNRLDIRYATDNNFRGTPVYTAARALCGVRRPRRWRGSRWASPLGATACSSTTPTARGA